MILPRIMTGKQVNCKVNEGEKSSFIKVHDVFAFPSIKRFAIYNKIDDDQNPK